MKTQKNIFLQYKVIITLGFLVLIAAAGYAQVDQDEMRELPPVTFINYEGPHARVNTREEIRQIGVGLGRVIAERERGIQPTLDAMTLEQRREYAYRFETGANNRYFIIHSISGPEGSKLNADILGLGVDTGVDHIRNLRVIIQGYLQSAYNYSASDALLLAEFITIYNAVYRGNWDYFTGRFKTPVISHLTRERAGISIRYDEWPGRTLLLIPLGHGHFGSIDTSALTDRSVIEEMRREDDQGVPQRQGMVELIEREADRSDRQVQRERQEVRQEERRVTEERRQVTEERRQVTEERAAGRITEDQARTMQEALARRENELARREEALAQRTGEIDEQEEATREMYDHAQTLRDRIAEDQQRRLEQEQASSAQDQGTGTSTAIPAATQQVAGILGVTIENQTPTTMGRIVQINPANGSVLRRSPLNLVHSRTVFIVGGKLIAIAGENRGNHAVRLVEMNQTTLEMIKQGDDDIQTGSLLWVNGNDLYAITVDLRNNQCFLGRFNTDLVLQARSTVRIHPEASVIINQGRLMTQRDSGAPLILNPMDLTEVR